MKRNVHFLSRLRYLPVWLSRAGHCKGFGIQSPWAFNFVCKVVYGRVDDGVRAGLLRPFPRAPFVHEKLGLLYLRLASSLRPTYYYSNSALGSLADAAVGQGCRETLPVALPDSSAASSDLAKPLSLALIAPATAWEQVDRLVDAADKDGIFVVEGIHHGRQGRELWRRLLRDGRVNVTFDLYFCGILTFNPRLYKRNYVVCF